MVSFSTQYIESLLRKYIGEYVACQMCRSFNTSLTRDNVSRLFFVSCQVRFICILSAWICCKRLFLGRVTYLHSPALYF